MIGLPIERVRVELGDTNFPQQRVRVGHGVQAARARRCSRPAMRFREKLAQMANMDPKTARFANGGISSGEHSIELTDLVRGGAIEADGEIQPGRNNKDFSQQSYGAHFAEVGVDADTGEVCVRRMLGVFTAAVS